MHAVACPHSRNTASMKTSKQMEHVPTTAGEFDSGDWPSCTTTESNGLAVEMLVGVNPVSNKPNMPTS